MRKLKILRAPVTYAARLGLVLAAIFYSLAILLGSSAGDRQHLHPKFTVGEVLRYQISTRTTTTSNTTTPIVNAEGASQLKQTLLMQLRIDVLAVEPGASGGAGTVRLRATYEKASATSETDSYDPDAATVVDQFNKLEGRAVEFTIDADGKLSHVAGLDQLLANPVASNTVRSSMSGFSASAQFPRDGIVIGQKWTNEHPLENTPLAGLTWRTESTYLRNESVAAPESGDLPASATTTPAVNAPAAPKSTAVDKTACAVIVTKFQILRHGPAHGDATPPDYVHNGLRTSGTWTGTGESLDSISLATGFVVRSTQNTKQNMDFEVLSPTTGSKIHYVGQVETESHITLLP